MPQHKAARGEKPAATRARNKGPGRHAYGVPTLTQDEILAAYPFLGGPAFVPVERADESVEVIAVAPVSVVGLSDPEDIAAAWSSEAEQLEQARQERIQRAEERRIAREREAAEAAERARADAEAEAERIRALRDAATAGEVEREQAADAAEVGTEPEAEPDAEGDTAEQRDPEPVEAEEDGAGELELPAFFTVPETEVQPLPPVLTVPDTDDTPAEPSFAFPFDEPAEPLADDLVAEEIPVVEEEPNLPVLTLPTLPEPETETEESAEPAPTAPAFTFNDIIGGYADEPEAVTVETEAPVDVEDADIVEAVPVEADEPSTVVAEIVEDTQQELAPATPPQEVVHIHHHYHEPSEPVAPQIIIAPPPVYAAEWPEGAPAVAYPPADLPRRERRPQQPVDDRRYDDTPPPRVTETHFDHYVPEEEPERPRPGIIDDGPIKFDKPKKEPFFTFFGRPLGGGKEQARPSGQRPIEPRRTQSNAARLLADGTESITEVDSQTWFDQVVQDSIDRDASDLHIRVESDGTDEGSVLRARVRIDGRMRHLATLSGANAGVIINRFKTGAALSSDGSFVPEESVYEILVDGEYRKARVALFRTSTGGDALVLRLPPRGPLRTLDDLNFAPENEKLVRALLGSANRMVMIAGPMGSGKTTTAQAALMSVTTPERSVWSLEDPVERDLPNVTQLELDERNGAGFDAVLPVLVRSDYDTLFLGEIRDPATAGAGVRQAKAGRQVITTIHANDNVGALYRLIELSGESPREVLDSVAGVMSQRLVGRLNPDWDGVDPETKYRGRVPIHEVLRITPELIEAVMRDEPITKVQALVARTSESTFIADAQRLVNERVTDVEEVSRVLGLHQ